MMSFDFVDEELDICWNAKDLLEGGYIKTLAEWEEFCDIMADVAMTFFDSKGYRE